MFISPESECPVHDTDGHICETTPPPHTHTKKNVSYIVCPMDDLGYQSTNIGASASGQRMLFLLATPRVGVFLACHACRFRGSDHVTDPEVHQSGQAWLCLFLEVRSPALTHVRSIAVRSAPKFLHAFTKRHFHITWSSISSTSLGKLMSSLNRVLVVKGWIDEMLVNHI